MAQIDAEHQNGANRFKKLSQLIANELGSENPSAQKKRQLVKEIKGFANLYGYEYTSEFQTHTISSVLGTARRHVSDQHCDLITLYFQYKARGEDSYPAFCKQFLNSYSESDALSVPNPGLYEIRRYAYLEEGRVSVSALEISSHQSSPGHRQWHYVETKEIDVSDKNPSVDGAYLVKKTIETKGSIVNNYHCHMFVGQSYHIHEYSDGNLVEEYAGLDVKYVNMPITEGQTVFRGLTVSTEGLGGLPFCTRITLEKQPSTKHVKDVDTGVFSLESLGDSFNIDDIDNDITGSKPYLVSKKF